MAVAFTLFILMAVAFTLFIFMRVHIIYFNVRPHSLQEMAKIGDWTFILCIDNTGWKSFDRVT